MNYRDKELLGIELNEDDIKTKRFNESKDNIEQFNASQLLHLSDYYSKQAKQKLKLEAERKREEAIARGEIPPLPTQYVDLYTSQSAHRFLIENNSGKEEAMEYAAKIQGKPEGWIDKAKHSPFNNSKNTMKSLKDHPVQKDMLNSKSLRKSVINRSDTWNKYMSELEHARKTYDTYAMTLILKKMIAEQQKEIDTLKAENITRDEANKNIESEVEGINEILGNTNTNRQKGKILREQGYTQKDVSEMLGVTILTVKRWDKRTK